ncbi:hypothetical protein JSE7799_00115 [Jannaschia seosinensis]|uniref:Uncharacterized protein n=1 Tax=Jannaschia seosinensis TaxID=313367 RepID=A0A0M7B615_9RHOB|nr:hypothetical protein JSE7799_00115 [Jannaschia seosinensis]
MKKQVNASSYTTSRDTTRGDRRGVEHVDWVMAEVVLLKSESLASITKKYIVSDGYATSAAFS